jgi:hypothetical protein
VRKWLASFVVVALSFALLPQTALAHELVTDSTNRVGLILHVEPDDNPTAGVASKLEFIMQSVNVTSATLRINGVAVTPTLSEGVISASYTFPAQGEYTLHLTVNTKDGAQYDFNHSLEVLRGVTPEPSGQHTTVWAIVGLIGSLLALLTLGGVGWRWRRAIAARSYRH